ncbi:hypothetical protein GF389_02605 [Candidatus Dojkabacteria bacterium]|nr:hypothetical protein [Candidatus Dojkabacteria bacterium]
MNKQKKIEELERKIKELQKQYKSEVKESFKEAQQTQEMIQTFTKQVQFLKSSSQKQDDIQVFRLKHPETNEERTIKIGHTADPINQIITAETPVGRKLLQSKPGDSIFIGEMKWEIF